MAQRQIECARSELRELLEDFRALQPMFDVEPANYTDQQIPDWRASFNRAFIVTRDALARACDAYADAIEDSSNGQE